MFLNFLISWREGVVRIRWETLVRVEVACHFKSSINEELIFSLVLVKVHVRHFHMRAGHFQVVEGIDGRFLPVVIFLIITSTGPAIIVVSTENLDLLRLTHMLI